MEEKDTTSKRRSKAASSTARDPTNRYQYSTRSTTQRQQTAAQPTTPLSEQALIDVMNSLSAATRENMPVSHDLEPINESAINTASEPLASRLDDSFTFTSPSYQQLPDSLRSQAHQILLELEEQRDSLTAPVTRLQQLTLSDSPRRQSPVSQQQETMGLEERETGGGRTDEESSSTNRNQDDFRMVVAASSWNVLFHLLE